MNPIDKTPQAQTETMSFEFDLPHPPEKVWRALTVPGLLAEWLLPVVDLTLEPGGGIHVPDAAVSRMGRHRELPVRRDRSASEAQLRVERPLPGHGRDVHAHAHGVGHAPVPGAVGLQAGPEAGIRRRALRLEDDGREARRPAREDP